MQLNAYLNFDGQCEAAFKFYEQALGGKIIAMMPFEGSPMADQVPPESHSKIIHARLTVGDQVLMGSDSMGPHAAKPQGFAVSIGVSDPAEAERIFHALSEGGKVDMPIQETFWAARFAMFVDRFGIPWMINCERPAQ
jgi:PhnB protein